MRQTPLLLVVLLSGCPDSSSTSSSPVAQASAHLVLVEAELAQSMRQGTVARDAFCEREVPVLEIRGSVLEARCGQEAILDSVTEERVDGARHILRTKDGREIVLVQEGRQRFRVTGHPCGGKAAIHVEYPDARTYRDSWLKGASCPTEDMKLAH
ncbi:MAG: hypothetical protein ABIJ09_26415 [Pseudomonadota bacterium]